MSQITIINENMLTNHAVVTVIVKFCLPFLKGPDGIMGEQGRQGNDGSKVNVRMLLQSCTES